MSFISGIYVLQYNSVPRYLAFDILDVELTIIEIVLWAVFRFQKVSVCHYADGALPVKHVSILQYNSHMNPSCVVVAM